MAKLKPVTYTQLAESGYAGGCERFVRQTSAWTDRVWVDARRAKRIKRRVKKAHVVFDVLTNTYARHMADVAANIILDTPLLRWVICLKSK